MKKDIIEGLVKLYYGIEYSSILTKNELQVLNKYGLICFSDVKGKETVYLSDKGKTLYQALESVVEVIK